VSMKTYLILFLFVFITLLVSCKKHDGTVSEKKWIVTTVAGDGRALFADGPALVASFKAPLDITVSADGATYVADAVNHRIRKIMGGQVITFAGSGTSDTIGGTGTVASFVHPSQLTIDAFGNLYTLDLDDPRVRKISPTASVTAYAGSGTGGFLDGRRDTAQFGEEASGIASDEHGNIYVADFDNRRIRKISIDGVVTTIAGNGNQGFVNGDADKAEFFSLGGIVIDHRANLFVADFNRVRKITPSGVVSTFAGNDSMGYKDGQGDVAEFSSIGDMVIDEQGNIYLSDDNRIRKITPQGSVSTIAGGEAGYKDGDASSARFFGPAGLGIDKQGNLYVADANNDRIRKLSFK